MSSSTSPVIGFFAATDEGERAFAALEKIGFHKEEMRLIPGEDLSGPDSQGGSQGTSTVGIGTGVGVLAGTALGGLAAGAVPGMLASGVAGGLIGALVDLGIPVESDRFEPEGWQTGNTILAVRAGSRAPVVVEVLRRQGAREVRVPTGQASAP